jgi:hypothetical protein
VREELEELLVRARARRRQPQLEQRILRRVEVDGDNVRHAVEEAVHDVAAARGEHQEPVLGAKLEHLAVDTRVLRAQCTRAC